MLICCPYPWVFYFILDCSLLYPIEVHVVSFSRLFFIWGIKPRILGMPGECCGAELSQPPHSSSRFHISISLHLMWQFLSLEKENCQTSVRKPGKLHNQRFIFLAIDYFCLKYCLPWINLVTFITMYNTYFIIYVWEANLEFM